MAQQLIDAGIPVVVCRPNLRWRPGESHELWMPSGWHMLSASDCSLHGFRPGVDTLAMVGGHGIDVVDVDTKDGGSVHNLPPFRSFGLVRTPSGGWHYLVRSTGLGKVSPLTSLGHELEHLAFPRREAFEGVVVPTFREQRRDDDRVDGGAAVGDALYRSDELVDVADAVVYHDETLEGSPLVWKWFPVEELWPLYPDPNPRGEPNY